MMRTTCAFTVGSLFVAGALLATAPVAAWAEPLPDPLAASDAAPEHEEADDEELDEGDGGDGESEVHELSPAPLGKDVVYTADLSDEELERRFVGDAPSLGSISVGFADEGRMLNAVQMPRGDSWDVVVPEYAWGVQETIDAIVASASAVGELYPGVGRLRVNHISRREGGHLRPHRSHQSGRDVDFGFYYENGVSPGAIRGHRAHLIDPAPNWALVRELVTRSDVQVILVDRGIIRVLHDYALSAGEDPEWLRSIFAGPRPLVQHARRHRDHFHVRFLAPRSQELGRRIQPLLAKRPDENLAVYRVRPGDTLGHIAARFGSTVSMIQKANRMTSTFLSVSRTLLVPLRGPCTRCPLPPPVVVPPRRLPPDPSAEAPPSAGIQEPSELEQIRHVSIELEPRAQELRQAHAAVDQAP